MKWFFFAALLLQAGCETVKPYEKEYLLSSLMDDQGVQTLTPTLIGSGAASIEKLAQGSQAAGGSACPTCGG